MRSAVSALAAAAFGLALAWTWPLVTRLSWRLPHDPGDPLLNAWILWWNTLAVADLNNDRRPDIVAGMQLTGHFLLRDLLSDRSRPMAEARARLVDSLRRAAGQA